MADTTVEDPVPNTPENVEETVAQFTHSVFNNYYFTLLKKLKDIARANKSVDKHKQIIKAVKAHYLSYDRSSEEYLVAFREGVADVLESWESVTDLETGRNWLNAHAELALYKDVTLSVARDTCDDDALLLYFLVVFMVCAKNPESNVLLQFVDATRSIKVADKFAAAVENITDDGLKKQINLMHDFYTTSITSGVTSSMKDIEDTSLGRLAKEIMEEVDVSTLTDNLNADGDILKSLGNPDSGLTKLLGTVSQKLISKMATGELNNETLMKDAMQFSSKLGKMPGTPQGMPDMSAMMQMFQGLMGNAGAPAAAAAGKQRTRVDNAAMSRVAKAKQLKRKLDEKRKKAQEQAS